MRVPVPGYHSLYLIFPVCSSCPTNFSFGGGDTNGTQVKARTGNVFGIDREASDTRLAFFIVRENEGHSDK